MPAATCISSDGLPKAAEMPLVVAGRCGFLDTLRGIFLMLMAINHVPSVLWPLTQQPLGFATAAEGFVFMAGLVVGKTYTGRREKLGDQACKQLLFRRAGVVYCAHLACVLGVVGWMWLYAWMSGTGEPPVGSPWEYFFTPWQSWGATLVMIHQPGLLDVLPMYCGFLVLTPYALRAFESSGKRRVLILSVLGWAITNLVDKPGPIIFGAINTGAFNFGAWQLLYMSGLAAGHVWAKNPAGIWLPPYRYLIGMVVLLGVLASLSHGWLDSGLTKETLFTWSNKNNVAPLRVLNVAVIACLLAVWFRHHRLRHQDFRIRAFEVLGKHSLLVFSVHSVFAIVVLGLPSWFEWTSMGPWLAPLIMICVLYMAAALGEIRLHLVKSWKAGA